MFESYIALHNEIKVTEFPEELENEEFWENGESRELGRHVLSNLTLHLAGFQHDPSFHRREVAVESEDSAGESCGQALGKCIEITSHLGQAII